MAAGADVSRVLVTGASSGIGRGVARRLVAGGEAVHLGGRDAARLRELAGELSAAEGPAVPGSGPRPPLAAATWCAADLAEPDGVQRLLSSLEGPVHGVVHAAGRAVRDLPLAETDHAALRDACALPLEVGLRLLQGLHASLRRSKGAVVLISSNLDRRPLPGLGAYSIAKAAQSQLARALALEWGADGIRVNAVCPGLVRTPASVAHPQFGALERDAVARTPLGRIAEVEDVAGVVRFLLGPEARHVTGQCWVVDGGASLPA